MFRSGVLILLAVMVLFCAQVTFASSDHPVTADQIIIAEPTVEKITNDKQVIVTVNITNVKVTDKPIRVSLVKINNKIDFMESLNTDLKVSVMRLSPNAVGDALSVSPFSITYNTSEPVYSENFEVETKTINRFFELKDQITWHNLEINSLNKKFDFDSIKDNVDAISKLSDTDYEAFKKWRLLSEDLLVLRKAFNSVQVDYLKYFENQIMLDEINKMSYYKVVGKLPNGNYKLRFLDTSNQLIKQFSFTVVDKEESIKLLENFSKPN
jgi:hypothetical protein